MTGYYTYHKHQSIPDVQSFSPSAGKPERFMELLKGTDFRTYTHNGLPLRPVTREDLCLVHDKAYVDGVFDGTVPNGFGNYDPRVPEACLWTVGSLTSAALQVQDIHMPICSPTSGFHHAGYDFGEGYCTFNGLMVAAAKYLEKYPHHTVAILDCDFHYGNGTDDILRHKPDLAKRIVHHTSGKYFHPEDDPLDFFQWLHHAIEDINDNGCNLTLYQAGADMHKDDPLGGILDDADMTKRDRTVFGKVRGEIVWNLAGGYRRAATNDVFDDPVLALHLRTMGDVNRTLGLRAELPAPQRKRHND